MVSKPNLKLFFGAASKPNLKRIVESVFEKALKKILGNQFNKEELLVDRFCPKLCGVLY